jgi:hypothetical protein
VRTLANYQVNGASDAATPGAGNCCARFQAPRNPDQYLSLSELRGRRVILSFYPADWSPVCGDQITLYNQAREEFHKYDAEILGRRFAAVPAAIPDVTVEVTPLNLYNELSTVQLDGAA